MKSLNELREMLVVEVQDSYRDFEFDRNLDYYNEISGSISFILARILELELRANSQEWVVGKWIDDSLLTKIKVDLNRVKIWGVMIWGRDNGTSDQWTSPFYFEIDMDDDWTSFIELTFLFVDEELEEVRYEEFSNDRKLWDEAFYSDDTWSPSERNWEYVIHSKSDSLC